MLLGTLVLAACAAGPGASGGGDSGWTQVTPPPAALAGVSLLDVAPFGSGFVAVGNAPDAGGLHFGGAFTSTDGSTWTAAPTEPFKASTVAVVGKVSTGLLALGDACGVECGGLLSWLSTNGVAWAGPSTSLSLDMSNPAGFVEHGSTIIVVANELLDAATNHYRGRIFLSTDGATWSDAPNPDTFDETGLGGIATDGNRMVIVGNHLLESGARDGGAWTSNDGLAWTAATDDGSFKGALLQAVVHGAGGYLAAGSIGADGAIWISSDGTSWTRVDGGAFKGGPLTDVATTGSGYLVIGRGANGGAAWTSTDGKAWHSLGALPGSEGTRLAAAATGLSRSIIVGQRLGTAGSSLVWLGPLP